MACRVHTREENLRHARQVALRRTRERLQLSLPLNLHEHELPPPAHAEEKAASYAAILCAEGWDAEAATQRARATYGLVAHGEGCDRFAPSRAWHDWRLRVIAEARKPWGVPKEGHECRGRLPR